LLGGLGREQGSLSLGILLLLLLFLIRLDLSDDQLLLLSLLRLGSNDILHVSSGIELRLLRLDVLLWWQHHPAEADGTETLEDGGGSGGDTHAEAGHVAADGGRGHGGVEDGGVHGKDGHEAD